MHGFFKRDFPKLIRYTDKHEMIIKTLLPKVHKKFVSLSFRICLNISILFIMKLIVKLQYYFIVIYN